MKTSQSNYLTNLNRILIFALTAIGLATDGLQFTDLLSALALFVWLWLPLCTRLELQLLQRFNRKQNSGTS